MIVSHPLLSVVIANYNYGRFLSEAIESLLSQSCQDYELIICDGGSTDNSVEVIKKYADRIAWWCSEKDGGQSNAFNKGFSHASGKFLTWLNADDVMLPGTIAELMRSFREHPGCEWFTGNFVRFDDRYGKITEVARGPSCYPTFLQTKHSPLVVFGPTTFFARSLYERVGRIDESFFYAMDTDLWTRFVVAGVKQRRLNVFCWAFRNHDESKTEGEYQKCMEFEKKLKDEHQRTATKTGYRPLAVMRLMLAAWRLLDGSYCYAHYLQKKYVGKTIKEINL